MAKKKTQAEIYLSIRKKTAPPSKRHTDRKKAANKKACRRNDSGTD